ncbi:MAG: YggT family protein [Proteobacteria bacterium]|nr:YggT family protein [Pseudomonadota bacterium]
MTSLVILLDTLLELYIWCLLVFVVMGWLISFRVVNTHNRLISVVNDFLYRLTEPALRPIRRVLPNLGGIDISPVVLILLIWFARNLLREYFA